MRECISARLSTFSSFVFSTTPHRSHPHDQHRDRTVLDSLALATDRRKSPPTYTARRCTWALWARPDCHHHVAASSSADCYAEAEVHFNVWKKSRRSELTEDGAGQHVLRPQTGSCHVCPLCDARVLGQS